MLLPIADAWRSKHFTGVEHAGNETVPNASGWDTGHGCRSQDACYSTPVAAAAAGRTGQIGRVSWEEVRGRFLTFPSMCLQYMRRSQEEIIACIAAATREDPIERASSCWSTRVTVLDREPQQTRAPIIWRSEFLKPQLVFSTVHAAPFFSVGEKPLLDLKKKL